MSKKTNRPCFLRKTEIKLADGKTYAFRALPMNRRTLPIIRAIMGDDVSDADRLEGLLSAVEISMSFDQSPEEVEEALESGAVTVGNKEIVNAMVAGLGG